jgi:hypothetical protein
MAPNLDLQFNWLPAEYIDKAHEIEKKSELVFRQITSLRNLIIF